MNVVPAIAARKRINSFKASPGEAPYISNPLGDFASDSMADTRVANGGSQDSHLFPGDVLPNAISLRLESHPTLPEPEHGSPKDKDRTRAAILIQTWFWIKYGKTKRLHRKNLLDRMGFETTMVAGTTRLFNFLVIFVLMAISVQLSARNEDKRGIMHNLDNFFDFEVLSQETTNLEALRELLPDLAEKSRRFLLQSSDYWDPIPSSYIQYVGDMRLFHRAIPVVEEPLVAHGSFAFVAWIEMTKTFTEGHIIRKPIARCGDALRLSCWGWYLHQTHGMELHYGANDHFEGSAKYAGAKKVEVELRAPNPKHLYMKQDHLDMISLVVTPENVTFYLNLENLGTVELNRPITDCLNPDGIRVGATGLKIGHLTYYAHELSYQDIYSIYTTGARLVDISNGRAPMKVNEVAAELAVIEEVKQAEEHLLEESEAGDLRQIITFWEARLIHEALHDLEADKEGRHVAPPAPHGRLAVNDTLKVCETTGRRYYSLIDEAVWLTVPKAAGWEAADYTQAEEPRYFDPASFPSFAGSGVTFTFWFRSHNPKVGGYILSAHDLGKLSKHACYSLWMDEKGFYFSDGEHDVGSMKVLQEDINQLHGGVWRHVSVQLCDITNQVRYLVDGEIVNIWQSPTPIRDVDCTRQYDTAVVALGHRFPDYAYGNDAEIADMRMYVEGGPGAPNPDRLRSDEIYAIAHQPPTGVQHALCTDRDNVYDHDWMDQFGHECHFYYKHRFQHPAVCAAPEPQEECPISCGSIEQCFHPPEDIPTFFVWDRIRHIKPLTNDQKGTICLGDHVTKQEVLEACVQWAAAGPAEDRQRMHEFISKVVGKVYFPPVNVTDCADLAIHIDEHCSFNQTAVDEFSSLMLDGGGDFVVAFWVRPLAGLTDLTPDGTFMPQLFFHESVAPPKGYSLALTAAKRSHYGEADLYSWCDDKEEGVEMRECASHGNGWSFVTYTRHNTTYPHADHTTMTNNKLHHEPTGEWVHCLPPGPFFSAIEFSQEMLVSPIMLIPKEVKAGQLQQIYNHYYDAIEMRDGPLLSNKQRKEEHIKMLKHDYTPRLALVSPPLVFQVRSQMRDCEYKFSRALVEESNEIVHDVCGSELYECDSSHTMSSQDKGSYTCYGGIDKSSFNNHHPDHFLGTDGYVDFLSSVAEAEFLFRGDHAVDMEYYLDPLTRHLDIIFPFYAPQFGVTSAMLVRADMARVDDVRVEVQVFHIDTMEGTALRTYLVLQGCVLVNILLLFVDNLCTVRNLYRKENCWTCKKLVVPLLDFAIVGTLLVFSGLNAQSKVDSGAETERYVGDLAHIPWGDPAVDNDAKVKRFEHDFEILMEKFHYEATLQRFCTVILFLLVLRVVAATSSHPRLALLTDTLIEGIDDLWHAMILIFILTCMFAQIGTWRFGAVRDDFATLQQSMLTLLETMISSGFPQNYYESTEMIIFTASFIAIGTVLVLNFLLALIVEAYMNLRNRNQEMVYEQEFFTDIYHSYKGYVLATLNGWPNRAALLKELDQWESRHSLQFEDLHKSGLFRSGRSIVSFIDHYRLNFDFMEPEDVTVEAGLKRVVTSVLRGDMAAARKVLANQRARKALEAGEETEATARPLSGVSFARSTSKRWTDRGSDGWEGGLGGRKDSSPQLNVGPAPR